MQLPRSLLDSLSDQLNRLGAETRRAVKAEILTYAATLADEDGNVPQSAIADLRDHAIEVLDTWGGAAADMASEVAADFYDTVRVVETGDSDFKASAVASNLHAANDKAVRGMVQAAVDSGRAGPFAEACAERADAQLRRSANETVAMNARRDPKRPRWARVPTGSETCEFCIMLASRGFVYHTEETASHAHSHCDCRITPSFGGATVEGYDPAALCEQWKAGSLAGRVGPSGDRSGHGKGPKKDETSWEVVARYKERMDGAGSEAELRSIADMLERQRDRFSDAQWHELRSAAQRALKRVGV